jgi:Enoyl-(Acyl carrier protein) reductase
VPFIEQGQQRSAIVTGAARHQTRDRAATDAGPECVVLASPDAGYVTGQSIVVDGGMWFT